MGAMTEGHPSHPIRLDSICCHRVSTPKHPFGRILTPHFGWPIVLVAPQIILVALHVAQCNMHPSTAECLHTHRHDSLNCLIIRSKRRHKPPRNIKKYQEINLQQLISR
ncbi:hypothetical protein J3458_002892 [Metarhizium acridum]|uniref:uncharacterized protein n=1 Tax=Metarhizium acridum TaxID=92637 RepID=UPI001C6CC437|nr:hypothetical protein J3458_002892 [Metarhizium acridum]